MHESILDLCSIQSNVIILIASESSLPLLFFWFLNNLGKMGSPGKLWILYFSLLFTGAATEMEWDKNLEVFPLHLPRNRLSFVEDFFLHGIMVQFIPW